MPAALPIPSSWDDVSPGWMTAALAPRFPGVEVGDVTLLLRDDGTNRRARFGLSYAGGEGPATVFLKACDPAHAKLNARTGGVLNEPRLFAGEVSLAVDHPRVHRSLIDEPALDFLLVMEDIVARGGDPRDATRPLTIDQAADGVRGLARLHSGWWGDRFDERLSWVEPFAAWKGMGVGVDMGLDTVGDVIPTEVRRLAGAGIERAWLAFVGTLADGPQTLLHGDPHIGNTYVLPGDRLGFLDWQVVRRGNPSLDLGYFLQGAVTVEDRRRCEEDLVRAYHDALDVPAGERPPFDDVWLRYRASAAHGVTIWVATAASNWQRAEVSLALAERYSAAFADLDAAQACDELSGPTGP